MVVICDRPQIYRGPPFADPVLWSGPKPLPLRPDRYPAIRWIVWSGRSGSRKDALAWRERRRHFKPHGDDSATFMFATTRDRSTFP